MIRRLASTFAGWLLLAPGPAYALTAPDSVRLESLQEVSDSAWRMRVVTRRGTFEMSKPRFDSAGVHIASSHGHAALLTVGHVPPDERLVRWSDIERVDSGRGTRAGQGALIGLAVGAGLGALELSRGPDGYETGDNLMVYFAALTTATMTVVGLVFGASNPQWKPLLP